MPILFPRFLGQTPFVSLISPGLDPVEDFSYSSVMESDTAGSLSDCPLFHGVPRDKLSIILDDAGARREEHASGKMVRQQGDRYDALILLASGRLKARFDSNSGKAMVVEHFEAPTAVATAVLTSAEPILPVSLICEEDSVLVTISYEKMLELFAREPTILKAYLMDAGNKVRFLAEKLRLMRFGSLRMKIVAHLLTLAREQGTASPRWRYGREQMADLLGVARPSLSRELSKMSDDELLEMPDRNRLHLNLEALEDLSEGD